MTFACSVCKGSALPRKVEMHKMGRKITCDLCGHEEIMVRWVDLKPREPGAGKVNMSKKERRKFKEFLKVHDPELLEYKKMLDSLS